MTALTQAAKLRKNWGDVFDNAFDTVVEFLSNLVQKDNTPPELMNLTKIFKVSLKDARQSLKHAENEPLYNVAVSVFSAFEKAKKSLVEDGFISIMSANDTHAPEASDRSPLTVAMGSIYGFLGNEFHKSRSPKSIEALQKMVPIANEIHHKNLCIVT